MIHVRAIAGTSGLFANAHFSAGEIVLALPRITIEHPTVYTIQIDEGQHIDTTDDPVRYLNHSCRPSCAIDAERYAAIALRDITPGEEGGYYYFSNLAEQLNAH